MKEIIKILGIIIIVIIVTLIFRLISDTWTSGYYAGGIALILIHLFIKDNN